MQEQSDQETNKRKAEGGSNIDSKNDLQKQVAEQKQQLEQQNEEILQLNDELDVIKKDIGILVSPSRRRTKAPHQHHKSKAPTNVLASTPNGTIQSFGGVDIDVLLKK